MTSMRGSVDFSETGSADYCIKKNVAAIENSSSTNKKNMEMLGPTAQLLTESHCRANRAMARLKAFPCQTADQEIVKQVAVQIIKTHMKATETMLDAVPPGPRRTAPPGESQGG